jgi:hypothetical protein
LKNFYWSPFSKWPPQYGKNSTLLNFYRPFYMPCFGNYFENGRHLETQNCSSNGDLSLCQILCLYHYPFRSYLTMLNEKFLPVAIFKMAVTIPRTFNIVRFQRHFICR